MDYIVLVQVSFCITRKQNIYNNLYLWAVVFQQNLTTKNTEYPNFNFHFFILFKISKIRSEQVYMQMGKGTFFLQNFSLENSSVLVKDGMMELKF